MVFYLKKLEHIKKINDQFPAREVFRKCAACHAPAALVSGNIGNHTPPSHDEQFEGVSCSTCHSLETTGFSGGGDYTLKPQSQYLFYYSNNPFAQYLHNALIKNKPDLHKEAYTKTFYRESAACVGCHERLHFKSWKESAYNNEQEPGLSKHCQSCHMPDVHEEDEVSARITGTVKDHRFLSGGLTIAKLYHREKQFNKTKAFLQDKKIDVSIIRPLLAKPGGVFSFVVRNANLGVGHNFPAGPESDIVEAWVYIKVTDSNGIVLFEEGKLGSDNILDKTKCFVYYSHPIDSNGKKLEFDRHRSWIFVSDEHQLIAPRMFHDVPFQLKIPASAKGKIKIEASLNYRKPNQEFANWALGQTNFKVPHVSMDHDEQFVELSSDQERLSKALEQYAQVLQIQSLPGGIRKMHVFPKNEKQLDVESKIILHHVRELAKKGKINEALKNLQAIGSEVKKTRFYKETMEQVKRPNQVDNK